MTTLYVGTHDGILALTSQDGVSWQQGPATPLEHAAAKIGVAASEPSRAYLAAYESGVYRTDDAGATWRRLDAYPVEHAHSVAVHPSDPDNVYVGSEPAMVFHTSDGGESWEHCDGFAEVEGADEWSFHWEGRHGHVRTLALAPGHPERVYAGIEVGGMLRSTDAGSRWEALPGTDRDVHTIAFPQSDDGRIYVATAKGPFRTDDWGKTWTPIIDGLPQRHSIPIAPSPHDRDRVLVGVSENARRKCAVACLSEDAGRSWRPLPGLGAEEDMVIAFAWDPSERDRVYAGTDMGKLYRSTDAGATWQQTNVTLPRIAVSAMAVA